MKSTVFFLIFLCFAVCISSCKKDDGEVIVTPDPTLSATPGTFNVSSSGDTVSITITSNTYWQIASNSLWCNLPVKNGKGNATIDLYVAKNGLDARSGSVTLTGNKVSSVTIPVVQDAFNYYMEPDNTGMRPELSAIEFSHLMGLGWNVGNSLEAIIVNNGVYSGGETSWGNPAISKQLIDSVKDAGFNAIRIPVSWSHKIIDPTTYQINESWLKRVGDVIDYVLDNDMYAIINIHWDGGWMNQPTNSNKDAINKKLDAIWKQIAIYYRDYNDHLIFAGSNEIHVEGNYGAPTMTNITVQNSFNQTFVDAVRATGGKNTYRYLVVQAYNTNIDLANKYLILPTDITPDRLMAEVHFYDPWEFCLKTDVPYVTIWSDATWGKEDWVNEAFGLMKTKFVDNGIPVILGEYSVVLRGSLSGQALIDHHTSRNYYLSYVTNAAILNGMVPFYWDNGGIGDNGCGLFSRTDGSRVYPLTISAIVNHTGK